VEKEFSPPPPPPPPAGGDGGWRCSSIRERGDARGQGCHAGCSGVIANTSLMVKSGVKIPLSSCFPDGFVVQGSDVIRMWGLEQLKTAVSCEDTCFQGLGPVSVGASGFGIRVQFRVYFLAHAILAHDGPEPRESVAAKEEAEEEEEGFVSCWILRRNQGACGLS